MADDLGARLLRAGLVTRDQLAGTLAGAPEHDGALVAALVARGVPEDALAGFFLADGLGPLLDAEDLAQRDPAAARRLPGAMAADLLALPVRASPAGLVVAMAAPSDRHAVREIERAVGGGVLPTTACVGALRTAIQAAYPGVALRAIPAALPPESEPPVLELVRRRGTPAEGIWRAAGEAQAGKLGPGPRLATPDDDVAVPLVRTKPMTTPAGGLAATGPLPSKVGPRVITKSFARPSSSQKPGAPGAPAEAVAAYGEKKPTAKYATTVPEPTGAIPVSTSPVSTPAASISSASISPASIVPLEHERWDVAGATPTVTATVSPARLAPARASAELPKTKSPPREIGTALAAMRSATDRDEVVRLACEAATTVSRAAVFLALRKGVLKGWDGAGSGISRDSVRNLWIPTTTASTFKDVVETGEPYVGAYGSGVADGLFRAAIASHGGVVAIHAITVAGKVVGVLAADDLTAHGSVPKHRIEILAHAVAEAFKRILSTRR